VSGKSAVSEEERETKKDNIPLKACSVWAERREQRTETTAAFFP